jgi:hypothetical protein
MGNPNQKRRTTGHKILPDIAASLNGQAVRPRTFSKDEVEGIGIDVPGPILHDEIVNKLRQPGLGRASTWLPKVKKADRHRRSQGSQRRQRGCFGRNVARAAAKATRTSSW